MCRCGARVAYKDVSWIIRGGVTSCMNSIASVPHTYNSNCRKQYREHVTNLVNFKNFKHITSPFGPHSDLIILSALVTICETIPAFRVLDPRIFFGIESSPVALFTVEHVARALARSIGWRVFWRWVLCALLVELLST